MRTLCCVYHGWHIKSYCGGNPGVAIGVVGAFAPGERSDPIDRCLQMVIMKCSLYSIFINHEKKNKRIY